MSSKFTANGTLAEDYLEGTVGSASDFRIRLRDGERLGQAFFNALSKEDRIRITGTNFDPYYTYDSKSIEDTIEFLLYH